MKLKVQPITDEEIKRIEKLILPKGKTFYEGEKNAEGENGEYERVAVIKELNSCNVIACPGSGKTTTLLAKLAILAERMPFEDGRGICVLTHTNVAIDLIKDKLGSKSDILFSHPNFFGTIQSFVNKYLGIPKYIEHYGVRPIIDNDIYSRRIMSSFSRKISYNIRDGINKKFKERTEDFIVNYRFCKKDTSKLVSNYDTNEFPYVDKDSPTYKALKKLKCDLIKEGVVCFDEAYSLAESYIAESPDLINFFVKRFGYIFIDEMQDTCKHQIDLIEKLFKNDDIIIQYFGDPNQAIFNTSKEKEIIWKYDDQKYEHWAKHFITSSKRFGEPIAKKASFIKLNDSKEDSIKSNSDNKSVIPYLILYDKPSEKVLERFAKIIKEEKISELIEDNKKPIYKAVGAVGKENEEDKTTIKSYWVNYDREYKKENLTYESLRDYLIKQDEEVICKKGMKYYYDKFIDAILEVLELEGFKNTTLEKARNFNANTFPSYMKRKHIQLWDELRAKIFQWILQIHNSKTFLNEEVYLEIKDFIKGPLATVLEFTINEAKNFIEAASCYQQKTENPNICNKLGVSIELATVHAVKGETHDATLYLDTYYNKKTHVQRIADQIKGKEFTCKKGKDTLVKSSLKLAHVATTRPRYLMAIAMKKEDFCSNEEIEKHLYNETSNPNGWNIEIITGHS